jgi:hypothetical protein
MNYKKEESRKPLKNSKNTCEIKKEVVLHFEEPPEPAGSRHYEETRREHVPRHY